MGVARGADGRSRRGARSVVQTARTESVRFEDVVIGTDGTPIVPGSLTIEGRGEGDPWGVPRHSWLALQIAPRSIFRCSPVRSLRRLDNGFHEAVEEAPVLFCQGMVNDAISMLEEDSLEPFLMYRRAQGRLEYSIGTERLKLGYYRSRRQLLATLEISGGWRSEGLHIVLSGQLGAVDPKYEGPLPDPPPSADRFRAEALVGWATLVAKGFRTAHWHTRLTGG